MPAESGERGVSGLNDIHGPGSLQLQISFEALIVSLVTPLVGGGVPAADLRAALRRVVDNEEAWQAIVSILVHAEAVVVCVELDVAEQRAAALANRGQA